MVNKNRKKVVNSPRTPQPMKAVKALSSPNLPKKKLETPKSAPQPKSKKIMEQMMDEEDERDFDALLSKVREQEKNKRKNLKGGSDGEDSDEDEMDDDDIDDDDSDDEDDDMDDDDDEELDSDEEEDDDDDESDEDQKANIKLSSKKPVLKKKPKLEIEEDDDEEIDSDEEEDEEEEESEEEEEEEESGEEEEESEEEESDDVAEVPQKQSAKDKKQKQQQQNKVNQKDTAKAGKENVSSKVNKKKSKENNSNNMVLAKGAEFKKDVDLSVQRDLRTLFVRNIPPNIKPEDVGSIDNLVDIRIKYPMKSKKKTNARFMFLEFKTEADAEKQYKLLQNKQINNREIVVDFCGSKSKNRKGGNSFAKSDVNLCKLYVSGFDNKVDKEEIKKEFPLSSRVDFPLHRTDTSNKGFCFVFYDDVETAKKEHDRAQSSSRLVVQYGKKSEPPKRARAKKRALQSESDSGSSKKKKKN